MWGGTLLGGLVTLAAGIFGPTMWSLIISTTVLTLFCGLALVFGSKGATLALVLNVWYIMALPLAGSAALITSVPGTVLGGVAGFLLIAFIEEPVLRELLFLACAFLMLATRRVNYAVFVSFLTIALILPAQLGGTSFGTAGLERVADTVLGTLIAFTAIILLSILLRKGRPDRPSSIRNYWRVMPRKKNT